MNGLNNDSEWSDYGKFTGSPRVEHISILNKLLQNISQTPSPRQIFRVTFRYDVFVSNSGGTDTLRDQILASLDSDLLDLIETRRLGLETVQELGLKKPILTNRPGIYAHIFYNPKDPDIVGIYIGAASMLTFRIKRHKIDLKGIARRRKRGKPERRTRHRALTAHQEFGQERDIKISGFVSRSSTRPQVRKGSTS